MPEEDVKLSEADAAIVTGIMGFHEQPKKKVEPAKEAAAVLDPAKVTLLPPEPVKPTIKDKIKGLVKAAEPLPAPIVAIPAAQVAPKEETADEMKARIAAFEKKEASEKRVKEELSALSEIKGVMGEDYTPELEEAMAKALDDEVYDVMVKGGVSAKKRMVWAVQLAQTMIGQPTADETEAAKIVKAAANTSPTGIKTDSNAKKNKDDYMKKYRETGADDDLQKGLGVDEDLKAMGFVNE